MKKEEIMIKRGGDIKEFTAEKQEQDVNFHETRKMAEIRAIGMGLSEVASKLRQFLETMPSL